jgi:hypothetical protein
MAKVLYGSQITDIAGSIGGLTFQKNASSSIVRLRPTNSATLSEAQIARNVAFSQASSSWSALSGSDKALWNAFAAAHSKVDYYGTTKILSGMNWFMSLYINALSISYPPLTVPPTYALPTAYPVFDSYRFYADGNILDASWSTPLPVSTDLMLVYASPLTQASGLLDRSNMFFLNSYTSSGRSTLDLWSDFADLWFDGHIFSVDVNLILGIKVGLVSISATSFLTSMSTLSLLLSDNWKP